MPPLNRDLLILMGHREISSFKLPFSLYTFLQRFHPERLSKLSEEGRILENGRLPFSMAGLFDPVLDAIEKEIEKIMQD